MTGICTDDYIDAGGDFCVKYDESHYTIDQRHPKFLKN